MNTSAKAFAPANISCIFKIYGHKNPRWMGSYGVGFTLNEGVFANVSKSKKPAIFFNRKKINFPTVKSVLEKLTKEKLRVSIKARLPLGCGFGLSGACALATAYSANRLLKLKRTKRELAVMAHTAEVENKSGLGDVINQFYGGFCLKKKPSSYFLVKKLPINNVNVYCRYFGRLSTKSVITNKKLWYRINKSASIALSNIEKLMKNGKKIKLSDVIGVSKEFAVNSGLLNDKRTLQAIKEIEMNDGKASMIMLGNSVFSDKPFSRSIKLRILDNGAHIS